VPFLEGGTIGHGDKPQDSWRENTVVLHSKMHLLKKKKSIISVENSVDCG